MTIKRKLYGSSVAAIIVGAHNVESFVSLASNANKKHANIHNSGPLYSDSGQSGRMERIEFKIYPDGRVEEKVLGVQGDSCLEITREINEKLGNVISSSPTEEMYQEEIKIDQTLVNGNTEGDGASWEGSSSW